MAEHRVSYREAIAEALREEMLRDSRTFIIGEDVGKFGGVFGTMRGLYKEFGEERVRDTPISETAIISFALGSAIVGMKPIAEILRMDWMAVCADEVVNEVAKMHYFTNGNAVINMTIMTCSEEWTGLGAQHCQSFEAWYAHVPGLKVVMPSNPYDAKGLLKASIRDGNPVIFVQPQTLFSSVGSVPNEEYTIPLGKAAVKREGKDVTILSWGTMMPKCLKAAEKLAGEGIQAEVIDPRTIHPFDMETLVQSVKKTGKLVIVHQAVKQGGYGAEIAARVQDEAFDYLDAPIKRVGTPFVMIPVNLALMKAVFPQEEQVIAAVKEIV